MSVAPKYVALFHKGVDRSTGNGPHGDCWLWTKSLQASGYGNAWDGAVTTAHRLSYRIHHGDIPKGLDVMHSCDVRHCVNPDHLSVGTRSQNMRDAKAKGRLRKPVPENCSAGHPLRGSPNLHVREREGRRDFVCRICAADRRKRREARKREARKRERAPR